ncbi:MAG: xanthine dehydrogenase family protein subunit M [Anaerolineaceae bacterium]|jgi:Aerobic-type carbon monoxide dehydrogenase, middle subunit CoxM/CutM homologs
MSQSNLWNDYYLAETLDEAFILLERYKTKAKIVAGGTDLVLRIQERKITGIEVLVDISHVPEIKAIQEDERSITIGACITLTELVRSICICNEAPLLSQAASLIAGKQIRNVATIGGNVVNASPAADLIPALLVLEAVVITKTIQGISREVPLNQFLLGVRKVDLQPNEIVVGFKFLKPARDAFSVFRKVQPRQAMAIAILNLAVYFRFEADHFSEVRIAMGSVAPTAIRLYNLESRLKGISMDDISKIPFDELLQSDLSPISDFRGTREYRLLLAQRLLQSEINDLLNKVR